LATLGLLGLFMPLIRCIKALLTWGSKTIEDLWVTEMETQWMFGRHDMHRILDLKSGVSASGNTDRQAPCGSSRVVPAWGRISAFIRHTMRCYDVLSQTPKAARNPLSRVQRWPFSHIHVPPSANCARAWSDGSDCAVATTAPGWSQPPSLADAERQRTAPIVGFAALIDKQAKREPSTV
jgi:hypothetical protein